MAGRGLVPTKPHLSRGFGAHVSARPENNPLQGQFSCGCHPGSRVGWGVGSRALTHMEAATDSH